MCLNCAKNIHENDLEPANYWKDAGNWDNERMEREMTEKDHDANDE